ncbi:MAG: peptidoglycan bridge formation glycyltransferase FemA/FemB family protein [Clostridia bacterium]
MIQYVDEALASRYEEFISAHPKGHFVKSLKWAKFKEPWEFETFISLDKDGNIRGSMLIFLSKVPHTKYTHMYCPRGPVVDDGDRETMAELCGEARAIAKKHNAYELSIDPDITENDKAYLSDLNAAGFVINNTKNRPEYLQARYVFRLDLEGKDAEQVFAEFHSKTRYNVRLSERKGVTCRIGAREDLAAFRDIMVETAVRDGFMARSLHYFEEMFDILAPENLRVYMMEYEGVAIAGAIAIYFGDKVWYLYGASSNRERNRMPNYMMQWEMIQWAIEKGCRIYDFRGVTGDMEKCFLEGLIRFKQGFGGEQVDFVGKMDMIFHPRAAKFIEDTQSSYRALIRRIGVWKNKKKK